MINSKNYNNKNRLYLNNYINYYEYRRSPAFTLLKIWHTGEKHILIKCWKLLHTLKETEISRKK